MSMSGHEKVTGFRYLLLLEELLRAECLRFPSNPGPRPDSYVGALTSNVPVFGNGAYREVIKGGALS